MQVRYMLGDKIGHQAFKFIREKKKYRCLCFIIVQPYHNFWEWGLELTL